ncbi:MAG: DNA-deoxyinosine glycosylase [Woeseiaceae bacterium]|nr:DNA-deoxyinosine glycosylase [Woeseiaceae bacterium]
MTRSTGFPPVAADDARVLVLGSLPSDRSIAVGEYYAHPRNAFWPIVESLFGIPADAAYSERVARLCRCRVALWDVLQSSLRPGSLDSAIDVASATPNRLVSFLHGHTDLRLVAFNGRKAADLFERRVRPNCRAPLPRVVTLPSTSPAHAAMNHVDKLARWTLIRDAAEGRRLPDG